MASASEREVIKATTCPTCKAKPGHSCVKIRTAKEGRYKLGDPSAGQSTQLHPRRKQAYLAEHPQPLDARRKQAQPQHGQ